MLWETAGVSPRSLPDVVYAGYTRRALAGWSIKLVQALHILTRPISLRLSAHFAHMFNARLVVEDSELSVALNDVQAGDEVIWLNPSLAVATMIDGLITRNSRVTLYFLDPVHRLGIRPEKLRAWACQSSIATYSPEQAAELGMTLLIPYAPKVPKPNPPRDLALVYVGSPSPKRLLWVLILRLHLRLRGQRGFLRLASRRASLARWFPGIFSDRIPFEEYAALCARARGVLELHERDAGGVTLRATLCEALGLVHLSNLCITAETVHVSLWDWRPLDRFLMSAPGTEASPVLGAQGLRAWLANCCKR